MNRRKEDYSEWLQNLLHSVKYNKKDLEKEAFLFQEGDLAEGIFVIETGKIRISKVTPDGREITFRICNDGDIISEMRLFCEQSTYTVQAKAIENTTCIKINKEELENHLLLNPSTNIAFMKMMDIRHQKAQSQFRDLILHGKKGALYSTLIRMTNSYGLHVEDGILINLALTNQELANFCGMSREVANRLLGSLKKDGKISMRDGKILIHDLQFLKDEIHCENCPIDICNID